MGDIIEKYDKNIVTDASNLKEIQRLATRLVTGLRRETAATTSSGIQVLIGYGLDHGFSSPA